MIKYFTEITEMELYSKVRSCTLGATATSEEPTIISEEKLESMLNCIENSENVASTSTSSGSGSDDEYLMTLICKIGYEHEDYCEQAGSIWFKLFDEYLDYKTLKVCRLVCKAWNFHINTSLSPSGLLAKSCLTFDGSKKSTGVKSAGHLIEIMKYKECIVSKHEEYKACQVIMNLAPDYEPFAELLKLGTPRMLLLSMSAWSQLNLSHLNKPSLLEYLLGNITMAHISTLVIKNCLLNWVDVFQHMFTKLKQLSSFSYILTHDVKGGPMNYFSYFLYELDFDIKIFHPPDYNDGVIQPHGIITKLKKSSKLLRVLDIKKLRAGLHGLNKLSLNLIYLEFTNIFLSLMDYGKCTTLEDLSVNIGHKYLFGWPPEYRITFSENTSSRLHIRNLLTSSQRSLKSLYVNFEEIPGGTDECKRKHKCANKNCCATKLNGTENNDIVSSMRAATIGGYRNDTKNYKLIPQVIEKVIAASSGGLNSKAPSSSPSTINLNESSKYTTSKKLPEEIALTTILHFVAIEDILNLHYLVQNLQHVEFHLGLITFQFADENNGENLIIRFFFNKLVAFIHAQKKLKSFKFSEICWTINVEKQLQDLVPLSQLARVIEDADEEVVEDEDMDSSSEGRENKSATKIKSEGIDFQAKLYALVGFLKENCDRNIPRWNVVQKYCNNLRLQWIFCDVRRLASLFDDETTEIMPFMESFQLINDTPYTFCNYDIDLICKLFPYLQKLHLEDITIECSTQTSEWGTIFEEEDEDKVRIPAPRAEIHDDNLLLIFEQLTKLRSIFIKIEGCKVTDYGFTGLELTNCDQNVDALMKKYKDKTMPLENLTLLESFTLLGKNVVTNVTAYLAFCKGLNRLKELNLGDGTAITKKGKKYLRQKLGERPGFKLTV